MPFTDPARAALLRRLFLGRPDVHCRHYPQGGWQILPGAPRRVDLERHVRGEFAIGLYANPVTPGFVVLPVPDEEGARALLREARARRVSLVPGVDGLRFWLPFSGPVPARTVRDVSRLLLDAAGLEGEPASPDSPQLLPPFADHPDPWEELARAEPLEPWRAARLSAERLDRDYAPRPMPEEGPPPEGLEVVLAEHVELRGPVPDALESLLEHTCMARTPRGWVRAWSRREGLLVSAPGPWPDLQRRLVTLGLDYWVEDRRPAGVPRPPNRRPVLRQEETGMLSLLLERDRCRTRSATPGLARQLARAAVAARAVPALVVTRDVLGWLQELAEDLDLRPEELGILDGEIARLGTLVTVGSWGTLGRRDLSGLSPHVAHLVVEADLELTGPAVVDVVRQFAARSVLTLEPEGWGASSAMRRAWLGEAVELGPREWRSPRPRPAPSMERSLAETPSMEAPASRRPRRRRQCAEQLLLSLEG